MTRWTTADMPDQTGRVAVVTGANTGVGLATARALAKAGATVVLACRDQARADAAAAETGGEPVLLDLASLASVRAGAERIVAEHARVDLLINNAGVMMTPRDRTQDGFELQVGINHLGHFALTGLLLPAMLPVAGSRIVTVSSNAHRAGEINFEDLNSRDRYRPIAAYAQSKLANLLFAYELQRRLTAAKARPISVAVHPGSARTELARENPRVVQWLLASPLMSWMMQDSDQAALPSLRAATDPAVRGGDYYGPDGWNGFKGQPVRTASAPRSHDPGVARRLWEKSERLTSVVYRFTDTAG
ncbi:MULTISPECIES: oxidoreductase [unclassified Kutzneria]|uniref:oxidoreductase n=1 Tax=unclassified Kutzneria TaxID=2621979 RepID=UPI0003EEC827|nr:oxidoreductase [Kutzneria sp. 744]EWM14902.1 short-chain dehydrogenase [Kutzneria sp. 744]